MAPRLFATVSSPPVRAVLITAKALGINLELNELDLGANEQLKASFVKLNPQHTVPTLQDDDDFVIWDSHIINGYLVDKYGGIDDSLYPSDLCERAKVGQKLFFDTELELLNSRIFKSILSGGQKSAPQEQVDEIVTRLEILEKFLTPGPWVALDHVTIADISLATTITSLDILVPLDAKKFPKIAAWLKKITALPFFTPNKTGLDKLRNLVAAALEG